MSINTIVLIGYLRLDCQNWLIIMKIISVQEGGKAYERIFRERKGLI